MNTSFRIPNTPDGRRAQAVISRVQTAAKEMGRLNDTGLDRAGDDPDKVTIASPYAKGASKRSLRETLTSVVKRAKVHGDAEYDDTGMKGMSASHKEAGAVRYARTEDAEIYQSQTSHLGVSTVRVNNNTGTITIVESSRNVGLSTMGDFDVMAASDFPETEDAKSVGAHLSQSGQRGNAHARNESRAEIRDNLSFDNLPKETLKSPAVWGAISGILAGTIPENIPAMQVSVIPGSGAR